LSSSSNPTNVPTPPWAEIPDVEAWPTVVVDDPALGYSVPVPALWAREPAVEHFPTETVHTYRGRAPVDWLSLRCLVGAVPSADLADWVEVCLGLTGFPVLPPAESLPAPPRLLDWSGTLHCPELATRLGADDLRVADCLAVCQLDSGAVFLRAYVLLARVAARAWNVNLSIFSACPPGAPEALVLANDHRRAAAVFGKLRLGPAPSTR
jgi:hypothetical protein